MSILHACCQLAGNGRWQVALSFSGLTMCGIIYIDIWIGLSNLMLATLHIDIYIDIYREKIRFHEVALQFPQGAEARGAEPPAAPGDGRRGGGRALAPTTSSTEGTTAVPATPPFINSSVSLSPLSIYKWLFDLSKQCRSTISHPIQLHLRCLRLPFFAASRMIHLEMTTKKWTVQLQSLSQRTSEPPKVLG